MRQIGVHVAIRRTLAARVACGEKQSSYQETHKDEDCADYKGPVRNQLLG